MQTKTRPPSSRNVETPRPEEVPDLHLDALSDEEIEMLLFSDEEKSDDGPLNLTTLTGLSLIGVGVLYLLQQLGMWSGPDISALAEALPWLAGVVIILVGFGVFSWGPKRKRKAQKKARKAAEKARRRAEQAARKAAERSKDLSSKGKGKSLRRSSDRMLAGVCGGIAEYVGVEPVLIRIAFVIGLIGTGVWPFLITYLALAYLIPDEHGKKGNICR